MYRHRGKTPVGGLMLDAGEMSAQWDGNPVELTVRLPAVQ